MRRKLSRTYLRTSAATLGMLVLVNDQARATTCCTHGMTIYGGAPWPCPCFHHHSHTSRGSSGSAATSGIHSAQDGDTATGPSGPLLGTGWVADVAG